MEGQGACDRNPIAAASGLAEYAVQRVQHLPDGIGVAGIIDHLPVAACLDEIEAAAAWPDAATAPTG